MFKKYITTGFLLSVFTASLIAGTIVDRNSDNNELSYSKEGVFDYDATNGWWWYKQKVVDQNGKETEIKEKMTTKEKISIEKEKDVVKLLKKQIEKLDAVKERLEYAYPNLAPIYSTNSSGKKCLTNSSSDCFVFPLQAEAQHVPVMSAWLSDPSPTNSREWLQWEAKYFNHLQKISIGNRFAFLSGGANAYPTDTTMVYSDNAAIPLAENAKDERELKIIESIKDKVGLMFFLGGNTQIEENIGAYEKMREYDTTPWNKLNTLIVVPSLELKNYILQKVKATQSTSAIKYWSNVSWKISPEAFTKFDISITPSVVATYKTKDNKVIWQNIYSGGANVYSVRTSLLQFLVYNDIVKPVEMSASINAAGVQKNMETNKPIIDEEGIYKDINQLEKRGN
jgi:hypothetical protein